MWEENIAEQDWATYEPVLREAELSRIRFALGGAFALAVYTNHLRYTKDLDIYVLPSEREKMIQAVGRCGMKDYFPLLAYDRNWIYRSYCESQIVDIIWGMPNQRSTVDEQWLTRGPSIQLRDHLVHIVPLEELFWAKIYVMQRDRCDWPDILNLLYHSGPRIDWECLLNRLGDDFPLLDSVLTIFGWLCPERAKRLPGWLREKIGRTPADASCGKHSHLLDTRPWFGEDFKNWPGK